MASELKTAVVPLNGKNYPMWKIQCRMALMKGGLWNIVDSTEAAPGRDNDRYAKFLAQREQALAVIVLSMEPSLLYMAGDPNDPTTVWGELANCNERVRTKFNMSQKETSNKLKANRAEVRWRDSSSSDSDCIG